MAILKNIRRHFLDHKARPANSNSVAPVGEQRSSTCCLQHTAFSGWLRVYGLSRIASRDIKLAALGNPAYVTRPPLDDEPSEESFSFISRASPQDCARQKAIRKRIVSVCPDRL